jgi:hypothetical protein
MTEINVEMFKRVVEQVEAAPEQHYQGVYQTDWSQLEEEHREIDYCGTTRCIGGWGLYFWAKDNGVNPDNLYEIVRAYGERHSPNRPDTQETAGHLFGLTWRQSTQLFYEYDEAKALEMAKIYASGGIPEPDEDE